MHTYVDEFNKVVDGHEFKGDDWFDRKAYLIDEYGPVVPGEDAIVYCSEFTQLVEVLNEENCWKEAIEEEGGSVSIHRRASIPEVIDRTSTVFIVYPRTSDGLLDAVFEQEPRQVLCAGEGGTIGAISTEDYGLVAKVGVPSFAGTDHSLFHLCRKL